MQNKTFSQNAQYPTGKKIPATVQERQKLISVVTDYVIQAKPVTPLSMEELTSHCDKIIAAGVNQAYRDYLAIVLNNELWRDSVAAVPYEKRLLLLPQCLRNKQKCTADFDELGLICDHCGNCPIGDIKEQAEQLGYAVLVAEGSPIVMGLIEAGKIEALIGVSCLAVLERTFPYMEAAAVPGFAVPLLYDGCLDTNLDIDILMDYIYLNSTDQTGRIDLNLIRQEVQKCFTIESLTGVLSATGTDTEKIAVDWIAAEGKRWRPFLTDATCNALTDGEISDDISAALPNVLIAVECFHKASLIHDDIEDDDSTRYGQKTLHTEYGIPIALNVGDYLLGEGYRLLTELDIDPAKKLAMLKVAACGHRNLCIGQGRELVWMRTPTKLAVDDVIEIFRKKTSPAFTVALKLAAILVDASDAVYDLLADYSDALGIAYQIRDDIEDRSETENCQKLSLLTAIADENPKADDVLQLAKKMLDDFRAQALRHLARLENPTLKGLLRKVMFKIFNDIDAMKCCDDYKNNHDTSRFNGPDDSR